ncbi:hypothetical protein ACIREM_37655 [Streptomyces shenzhenensis]|uniref:hypothetical protein n=1 Tax=Streptomyces shenzhenensis TaxID=943815 RepID=UPI00381D5ADE
MAEQKSSSSPVAPLRAAASAVRRVPGAEALSRAGEGILDKVESVSPRRRRLVVYAGAGVLGAVGVVEWPIALTGAAVAWLTQAGSGQPEGTPPAAGTARTAGTSRTAGTARAAGAGTARAAKAPAAASKRASTGRRTSASAPASTPASARKKTAPAARRGTTAKSGTSTRTAKKGTSTRTTAKQGRTTR